MNKTTTMGINGAMRTVRPGINWTFYHSTSLEDANAFFLEVTGNECKYDWVIQKEYEGCYSFRLHK